jgi:hypothetical protein
MSPWIWILVIVFLCARAYAHSVRERERIEEDALRHAHECTGKPRTPAEEARLAAWMERQS